METHAGWNILYDVVNISSNLIVNDFSQHCLVSLGPQQDDNGSIQRVITLLTLILRNVLQWYKSAVIDSWNPQQMRFPMHLCTLYVHFLVNESVMRVCAQYTHSHFLVIDVLHICVNICINGAKLTLLVQIDYFVF